MNERILAGRYRLQDAVGGRTDLFHAEDVSLRRKVAVKRLTGNMAGLNRQHWEQEIAKAACLHDPHLLSIYDVVMEDDAIYLITEDMDGDILARWVRERAPLTPELTADIVRQLAGAVVQVEQHGLEDIAIDPHSVLMTREGYVKVINYGPLYSSRHRGGSHADLVHTLGILMYEMLTGHPYSDLVPLRQLHAEVRHALAGSTGMHTWLPERMEHVFARAFGTSVSGLYGSIQDLYKDVKAIHHALGQAVVGGSSSAGEKQETAAALQDQAPEGPSTMDRAKEAVRGMAQESMSRMQQLRRAENKQKRTPLTYLWGALVIVLVAGALWWTLGDTKTNATTEPGVTNGGKEIKMPSLLNKTEEQAYQILAENGFPEERIQVVFKPTDDTVNKGKIYRQSADPNANVATSELIVLTINGEGTASTRNSNTQQEQETDGQVTPAGTVPDLKGLSLQEAEQLLLQHGFRYSYQIEQGDTAAGTVFKQDIAAGSAAEAGARVTFSVSQ